MSGSDEDSFSAKLTHTNMYKYTYKLCNHSHDGNVREYQIAFLFYSLLSAYLMDIGADANKLFPLFLERVYACIDMISIKSHITPQRIFQ